jgi:hypothetical protein
VAMEEIGLFGLMFKVSSKWPDPLNMTFSLSNARAMLSVIFV